MSRFVDKTATDEIILANGDKVWVRQKLTATEEASLNRGLFKVRADMRTGEIGLEEFAWHSQKVGICDAYVVGWDFRDDAGNPISFSRSLLAELDGPTITEIASAIDGIQKRRKDEATKKV